MVTLNYNHQTQRYEGRRLAVGHDTFERALSDWVTEERDLAERRGTSFDESIAFRLAWETLGSEFAWDETMPGVSLLAPSELVRG